MFGPARFIISLLAIVTLGSCISCSVKKDYAATRVVNDGVVISVRDQELAVVRSGKIVKKFPVSTSKFGLGDTKGSYKTPVGTHTIAKKIGERQPKGMVFKSRKPTGETIAPDSPGRDPIVSRILWLRGHENQNRNAFSRLIYIHGTAEERLIGQPASYGCIRMKSDDVCEAFDLMQKGDVVVIERCSISRSMEALHNSIKGEEILKEQPTKATAKTSSKKQSRNRNELKEV